MCVSVAAAVEVAIVLCDERGSCSSVPREEALCTDTLADRGGCVWPNWIYSAAALPHVASQHRNLQNKGIVENSSVRVRHSFSFPVIAFTVRASCTALTPKTLRLHV